MNSRHDEAILGHVRQLFGEGTLVGMAEGQLLERFVVPTRRGRPSNSLVARHGPMVLGVCRRVLQRPARRRGCLPGHLPGAGPQGRHSLRRSESLGNWLYGVAYRVAVRARAERRPTSHARAVGSARRPPEGLPRSRTGHDLRPVLDEEIARLPEKYRSPVVLCHLEGMTHEEAATAPVARRARSRAGWPGARPLRAGWPVAGWPRRPGCSRVTLSRESSAVRHGDGRIDGQGRDAARGGGVRAGVVSASAASLTEGVLEDHVHHEAEDDRDHLDGSRCRRCRGTGLAFQAPGGRAEAEQAEGGRSRGAERARHSQSHPSTSIGVTPQSHPSTSIGSHNGTSSGPITGQCG